MTDYDYLDRLDAVQEALEVECRRILRPNDELEVKGREIRIRRPDGMIRIPHPLFAGIDLTKVPAIVESYVAAFEDGRRSIGGPDEPKPRSFRIRSNRLSAPDATVEAKGPLAALFQFLDRAASDDSNWPAFPTPRAVRIDGSEGTTVFSTDAKDRWCEIHPDDLHRGWIAPREARS